MGADKDKADDRGETPLFTACFSGTECYSGYLEVVQILVENGADMNKANNEGETPLYTANDESNYHLSHYLESKGAKK